jgi:hypothetical protein
MVNDLQICAVGAYRYLHRDVAVNCPASFELRLGQLIFRIRKHRFKLKEVK